MHDGAPCHRSKVILKYLWKSKVEVFDLPKNSPDLNSIKNLWSYIKNKVAEKQPFRANKLNCNKNSLGERNQHQVLCIPSKKYVHPSCRSDVREKWTHKN